MTLGSRQKLWANWNELSQDTLRTDQDGDGFDDLFVCFFDAENAGDNDTGVGLVTGADLVLTQAGNIPGATGTPPSRDLDGAGDLFTITTTLADAFLTNDEWLILVKLNGVALATFEYIFDINKDATHLIYAFNHSVNTLNGRIINGAESVTTGTTGIMSAGTTYYVAMWKQSGGNVYLGFTTTRPTKLSDFGANDRVSFGAVGDFSGNSFVGVKNLFANLGNTQTLGAKVYYILMSKKSQTIINNAA